MTTITTPADRSQPLNVVGVAISVLPSGQENAAPKITFQSGAEGAGPPPHSHPWGECFYVIKGQVLFTVDGMTTTCFPGTFVHVPNGTVHAFSFGPGGGEMLEITDHDSRAISMFTALDSEVAPGPRMYPKLLRLPVITIARFISDAISCSPASSRCRRQICTAASKWALHSAHPIIHAMKTALETGALSGSYLVPLYDSAGERWNLFYRGAKVWPESARGADGERQYRLRKDSSNKPLKWTVDRRPPTHNHADPGSLTANEGAALAATPIINPA